MATTTFADDIAMKLAAKEDFDTSKDEVLFDTLRLIKNLVEETPVERLFYESTVLQFRNIIGIHTDVETLNSIIALSSAAKFTGDWNLVYNRLMDLHQKRRNEKLNELKNLFEAISNEYGFNGVLLVDEDIHWASEGDAYGEHLHKKAKEFHRDCLRLKSQANQEAYISKPSTKLGL